MSDSETSFSRTASQIVATTAASAPLHELPTYVIDCGSRTTRLGSAGDDRPEIDIPTVIGRPKLAVLSMLVNDRVKKICIGDNAMARRGILRLSYPMNYGKTENWDDMELFWYHALRDELRIDAKESRLFFTESARMTRQERETMAEIMFETFNVASFFTAMHPLLGLFSTGRGSGLAVESGHTATDVVPIVDGVPDRKAVQSSRLGGRALTDHLNYLLTIEEGLNFCSNAEREIVHAMKEELCYVASNYEKESLKEPHQVRKMYELPDGNYVSLGKARFKCPEVMFDPSIFPEFETERNGLTGMITKSIGIATGGATDNSNDNNEIRSRFFSNITLSGGNTCLEGIAERLLVDLAPHGPKVVAQRERRDGAWVGGSILASLSSMESKWVKKKEYEESGIGLVHERCE